MSRLPTPIFDAHDKAPPAASGFRLRAFRFLLRLVATSLSVILALGVIAWMIGRVASDRWLWSQWLLWIPTVTALAAALVGLLLAARPARRPTWRRRRVMLWAATAAIIAVHFALIEHHLLRRPSNRTDGLHVMHWNMSHYKFRQEDRNINEILALRSDILVLSHAEDVAGDPQLLERLGPQQPQWVYPFTIITRWAVLERRPLMYDNDLAVAVAVIDTTEAIGRPLVMYLVDLPSDATQSRAEIAQRVRRSLDVLGAPPPDLVMGDFNMTRGSYASGLMFPGMRDACDEAGAGYNATFRRDWPLYHIDQMLLGAGLHAVRHETIDPGFGRHRAQAAWITR